MWGTDSDRQAFGALYPLWHGPEPSRDRARVMVALRELSERGYVPAMFGLGHFLHHGDGVKADPVRAFHLYQQAADAGYPSAEGAVGNFLITATPAHGACPYDPELAAKWHERAAAHGNAGAQYNLAFSYWTGRGVGQDAGAAYRWAALAVHCSSVRMRPAETLRDQAAAALDADARLAIDDELARLRAELPLAWSEHLTYWKQLATEAGTPP